MRFQDKMEGTLWTKLAAYHTRLGNFEMTRSMYKEAMEQHLNKVRNFSILFDPAKKNIYKDMILNW